jgi:hypothetical protein
MDQIIDNNYNEDFLKSWSSKGLTWGRISSVLLRIRQSSPLFCDGPAKKQQRKVQYQYKTLE